jgi:hypothetical protein
VPADVFGDRIRNIQYPVSRPAQPQTEIDILKPDGKIFLIEAADSPPCLAVHHQKRSRRLIDFLNVRSCHTNPVSPVYRIRRY